MVYRIAGLIILIMPVIGLAFVTHGFLRRRPTT
jgi:hypothetical protein